MMLCVRMGLWKLTRGRGTSHSSPNRLDDSITNNNLSGPMRHVQSRWCWWGGGDAPKPCAPTTGGSPDTRHDPERDPPSRGCFRFGNRNVGVTHAPRVKR
jgi:hypothetical protein